MAGNRVIPQGRRSGRTCWISVTSSRSTRDWLEKGATGIYGDEEKSLAVAAKNASFFGMALMPAAEIEIPNSVMDRIIRIQG
jgi:hypothetical protein